MDSSNATQGSRTLTKNKRPLSDNESKDQQLRSQLNSLRSQLQEEKEARVQVEKLVTEYQEWKSQQQFNMQREISSLKKELEELRKGKSTSSFTTSPAQQSASLHLDEEPLRILQEIVIQTVTPLLASLLQSTNTNWGAIHAGTNTNTNTKSTESITAHQVPITNFKRSIRKKRKRPNQRIQTQNADEETAPPGTEQVAKPLAQHLNIPLTNQPVPWSTVVKRNIQN